MLKVLRKTRHFKFEGARSLNVDHIATVVVSLKTKVWNLIWVWVLIWSIWKAKQAHIRVIFEGRKNVKGWRLKDRHWTFLTGEPGLIRVDDCRFSVWLYLLFILHPAIRHLNIFLALFQLNSRFLSLWKRFVRLRGVQDILVKARDLWWLGYLLLQVLLDDQ